MYDEFEGIGKETVVPYFKIHVGCSCDLKIIYRL
jgi:hypothetical protein